MNEDIFYGDKFMTEEERSALRNAVHFSYYNGKMTLPEKQRLEMVIDRVAERRPFKDRSDKELKHFREVAIYALDLVDRETEFRKAMSWPV